MLCNLGKRFPRSEWGERFIATLRPEAEKMTKTPIHSLPYRYSVALSDTGRYVTAYLVDFEPKDSSSSIELPVKI